MLGLLVGLLLLGCGGLGEASEPARGGARVERVPRAEPWPEADALFRSDARWRGGDAAVSVDLGHGRVLWLFGDSFVAGDDTAPRGTRRGTVMVRNSIAIQRGRDPESAAMRFIVRDGPASFFPESGQRWYWPQHGILLEGRLTLFLYALVHDAGDPLGFRYDGWTALRVDNPGEQPEGWRIRPLQVPDVAPIEMVGASVLADAEHVYAYGVREPGDHALFLLRWRRADFVGGALGDPQRWAGPSRGWTRGPPAAVLPRGQTELSVVALGRRRYALAQTLGFGASRLALRLASAPQGPFGDAIEIFEPPEHGRDGILIYGARAHPELSGGELVLTYNVNTLDAAALMDDLSIYFPRFVRVRF